MSATRYKGYRYDELGSYPTAAAIAKAIRADIAQATEEGLLPGSPVRYSVRSKTYSGGCSVDVTVHDWPGSAWVDKDPSSPFRTPLTPEAEAVKMTLGRIHGAYNHDGSDIQTDYFDVRYYGGVTFEDAQSARWHTEEAERKRAKRQAIDAAAQGETRRIVNYSRTGKATVHDAVEVDGRLRLVCGAQLWRGALVGNGAGRELTCSRCAKKAAGR